MLFDHARAKCDGRDRDMDAARVIREADRQPERLAHSRHRAEVHRPDAGGIFGRAVKQRDLLPQRRPGVRLAQYRRQIRRSWLFATRPDKAEGKHRERVSDFVERRHACRHDDWQSEARQMQKQRPIGQVARPNLDRLDADTLDQMGRALGVERCGHVGDADARASIRDQAFVIRAEFESTQHIELGLTGAGGHFLVSGLAGTRGRQLVGAKRLKLDDVCARSCCGFNQRHSAVATSVMIDAGLGDDPGAIAHNLGTLPTPARLA